MLEITSELQRRIETHVGRGVFNKPSEVIQAALDILEERQHEYNQLESAIGQLKRGEVSDLNPEDIKHRGRERLG